MKALAMAVAMGSLVVAAPAAMAQQTGQTGQTGEQAGQTGGQAGQQGVEQLSPQAAQQFAQQPEVQQALKNLPRGAQSAITKAAQAQGGQLIGIALDTHGGTTYYEAQIERNGRLYQMQVTSDGKVMSWEPKTR